MELIKIKRIVNLVVDILLPIGWIIAFFCAAIIIGLMIDNQIALNAIEFLKKL